MRKTLAISFTDICNMHCPWCIADVIQRNRPAIRLWTDVVKERLFEHLHRVPYDMYAVLGGEPTLFPDELLTLLLRIRAEINPQAAFTLFTNGTGMTPHLADALNRFDCGVILSVNFEGPKGLEALLAHGPDVHGPSHAVANLRRVRRLNLRPVFRRKQPFAVEAVVLHAVLGGQVVSCPDYTTMKDWNEGDIAHIVSELSLLERLAPDHRDWHSMTMVASSRCDCSQVQTSFYPDGQLVGGSNGAAGTTPRPGRLYGCVRARDEMGEVLYNRYVSVTQTYKGCPEGEKACPL